MKKEKGFNKMQELAIKSKFKETLVLAGAGTGKTMVLTNRIPYLLSLGVDLSSILAVTFTNKAAGEMKERTIKLIENSENKEVRDQLDVKAMTIGTFHGVCHKILRTNALKAGLESDFTVIDTDDQKRLLKDVIQKLDLFDKTEDKKKKASEIKGAIILSLSLISSFKDDGLRPCHLSKKTKQDLILENDFDVARVYTEYEKEKTEMNILDFGDLILGVVELLEKNPKLKKEYNDRYRHVLIDEFQDTNNIQFKLINLLYNPKEGYLFVVGDDDQSIYEWRGAKIENILGFKNLYKNSTVIKLEQNYRSTNNILECANVLIGHNTKRIGKSLWSEKEKGSSISVVFSPNGFKEADYIANEIIRNSTDKKNYKDFAILYRSNYISRVLELKMNENKIPYIIIGGVSFWARMEIKALMSYFALAINKDHNIAFDRIINTPPRKLGAKKMEKIKEIARKERCSRFDALSIIVNKKIFKGESLINSIDFIKTIEDAQKEGMEIHNRIAILLENSNLVEHYLSKDGEEKGNERVLNMNELINTASCFVNDNKEIENDDIAFIDYAVLQSSVDRKNNNNAVQLMTIHAAKGLEFPYVFLPGWEEGTFPSSIAIKEGNIEEERRLAYVAITRAKERLTVLHAKERFAGSALARSRFSFELPTDLCIYKKIKSENSNSFYKEETMVNIKKSTSVLLKIGQEYKHERYGTGIIIRVKETTEKTEVTINFKGMIGIKNIFFE